MIYECFLSQKYSRRWILESKIRNELKKLLKVCDMDNYMLNGTQYKRQNAINTIKKWCHKTLSKRKLHKAALRLQSVFRGIQGRYSASLRVIEKQASGCNLFFAPENEDKFIAIAIKALQAWGYQEMVKNKVTESSYIGIRKPNIYNKFDDACIYV